jgi:hypothetical protein
MEQKKSHNITPKPDKVIPKNPRPSSSDRVREEEREQAIISPDRGFPKKKKGKEGPLSVGVNFDKSQG